MAGSSNQVDIDQDLDLSNIDEVVGDEVVDEVKRILNSQKANSQVTSNNNQDTNSIKPANQSGNNLASQVNNQEQPRSLGDQTVKPTESSNKTNESGDQQSSQLDLGTKESPEKSAINQPKQITNNPVDNNSFQPTQMTGQDQTDSEPTNSAPDQTKQSGVQQLGQSSYDSRESPVQSADETRERLANNNQTGQETGGAVASNAGQAGAVTGQATTTEENDSKGAKASQEPDPKEDKKRSQPELGQEKMLEPKGGLKDNKSGGDYSEQKYKSVSPDEEKLRKEELEKEKLAKRARQLKMAGSAQKAAGRGMQASGKTMKATGKGLGQAGKSMIQSGEALSETGLGAIAGVPLMAAGVAAQAAGAGMNTAGEGLDKAGQGQVKAGTNLQNLGKQIEASLGKAGKSGDKSPADKDDIKNPSTGGGGGEEMLKYFAKINDYLLGLSTGGVTLVLKLNARLLGTIVPFLEKLSSYFKGFNLRKINDIGEMVVCFVIDGIFAVMFFMALAFFSLIAFCAVNVGECLAKGLGMPEWMASVVANVANWAAGILGIGL